MDLLDSLPLVDGHCHVVSSGRLERPDFEQLLTESDRPAPAGVSFADSPVGLAVRRWCAPLLDLPAGAPLPDYLERREELGPREVCHRMLARSGMSRLLVDTGIGVPGGHFSLPELGSASGASVDEVVRLETVAEQLAVQGVGPNDFPDAYPAALALATRRAVGVKSILAYRHGFDVPPDRPSAESVSRAADRWLRADAGRLTDPVLLRFVLWCGLDRGLPVQVHAGFGDPDLRLANVNPALLQPLLEAAEPVGTAVILLHCYPYHREAGWLAAVYPHVYADVGLTLAHVGAQAPSVLAEFCELVPFGKLLFSTDAYGLPELYAVGAAQFRWALGRLLERWIAEQAVTASEAERIAELIGAENAMRVYGSGAGA